MGVDDGSDARKTCLFCDGSVTNHILPLYAKDLSLAAHMEYL